MIIRNESIFQVVSFSLDTRKGKKREDRHRKSTQASVFVIQHQSLTHEK
jgi:hypothetical protein